MTPREAPFAMTRRTCAALFTHPDLPARMDPAAAKAFSESLDVLAIKAFGTSLASDANFTGFACDFQNNVDKEAAWIVLTHAVDFGSGWRPALHAHHGKGAWLTIKPGVEALYQRAVRDSATDLPAAWLQKLTFDDVAADFAIANNAALSDLVDALLRVLHDLGRGLATHSYTSLEAMVKQTLPCTAADFVWRLVDAFPTTFNDRHKVLNDTLEVCFFKKAQLVTGELYHRFRTEDPDRFDFSDGTALNAYIDNVIVASLRYKGVVVPTPALTQDIESGVEIASGSLEEVCLRAAALCGVDAIVAPHPGLESNELGNYLWAGLGKEPAVRKFARHATKTVFY
jgi:hypothetical protein